MYTVVIVDVDVAISFHNIGFAVNGCTVAIKCSKAFFDDNITGNGL